MRNTTMYKSPNPLPEAARRAVADALLAVLTDGVDLHSQIKVAHWNIKGPHFAALHPLFDGFATNLGMHNDNIAERAVMLGGVTETTVRTVAGKSRIAEYPKGVSGGLEHVRLLAERFETYLSGLREARGVGEKNGDTDSVDLLTQVITEFEKHTWFLRASLTD
jgi:starvation-inducible DNA-binding protein